VAEYGIGIEVWFTRVLNNMIFWALTLHTVA